MPSRAKVLAKTMKGKLTSVVKLKKRPGTIDDDAAGANFTTLGTSFMECVTILDEATTLIPTRPTELPIEVAQPAPSPPFSRPSNPPSSPSVNDSVKEDELRKQRALMSIALAERDRMY